MDDKGQEKDTRTTKPATGNTSLDAFVLDKGIFSNIFEKDIRRVYIYKKAERLAKALHLVAPAFRNSPALRNRVDAIAIDLIDAATLPPITAREALSKELLTLSSVLALARTSGLLSAMNADVIAREAHTLLEEIATYEEPRLFLDDAPTLAALFKASSSHVATTATRGVVGERPHTTSSRLPLVKDNKGHVKDSPEKPGRREAILAILEKHGPSYIKDMSTVIRDVSEKTIQRELALLVAEGRVLRSGERRWTTYSLAS